MAGSETESLTITAGTPSETTVVPLTQQGEIGEPEPRRKHRRRLYCVNFEVSNLRPSSYLAFPHFPIPQNTTKSVFKALDGWITGPSAQEISSIRNMSPIPQTLSGGVQHSSPSGFRRSMTFNVQSCA